MSVNKQLEKVLAKIADITGNSSSGAMTEWWDALSDRSKIANVIDLTDPNGVLQDDSVNADIINDNSIEQRNLKTGSLDWDVIRGTPQGNSSSDPYYDSPRPFTERGSSFIPLFTLTDSYTISPIYAGNTYNLLTGQAESTLGFKVPIDIIYDGTTKLWRYPTLRFEYVFEITNTVPVDGLSLQFAVYTYDYINSNVIRKYLALDNSSPYFSGESSIGGGIKLKRFNDNSSTDHVMYFVAGEFNLNIDGLLDSISVSWFNFNSLNFPDTTEVNLFYEGDRNYFYKMGSLEIIPTISTVSIYDSLSVHHHSLYLNNKQLTNNGWAVSERALLNLSTPS